MDQQRHNRLSATFQCGKVRFEAAGVGLADDVPNHAGLSGRVMLKLIAARIAMGFRRSEISWGKTR